MEVNGEIEMITVCNASQCSQLAHFTFVFHFFNGLKPVKVSSLINLIERNGRIFREGNLKGESHEGTTISYF